MDIPVSEVRQFVEKLKESTSKLNNAAMRESNLITLGAIEQYLTIWEETEGTKIALELSGVL